MADTELRGRSILVTGASRGIGRRVALRLAALGAHLTITARSVNELESLAEECSQLGGIVIIVPADLTNPDERHLLFQSVEEAYGRLDILVNCAGVASFGEFTSSTEAILRYVMEINFFVPMELIRLALPMLLQSATDSAPWRPVVLNLASICGRAGIPSLPEHCASKHALVGMSEALRLEWERYGIDLLLVLPGLVQSDDLNRHLIRNEGRVFLDFANAQPADEVADSVIRSLRKRRREVAVGGTAWLVWISRRLWPRILRWVFARKVQKFHARHGG